VCSVQCVRVDVVRFINIHCNQRAVETSKRGVRCIIHLTAVGRKAEGSGGRERETERDRERTREKTYTSSWSGVNSKVSVALPPAGTATRSNPNICCTNLAFKVAQA
jgi:hypothetical protein